MKERHKKAINQLIDAISIMVVVLGAIVILSAAIYLVVTFWDSFLNGFCKVSFVCWQGSPNWLGWILVAFLGLLILVLCFMLWMKWLVLVAEEEAIWRE